MILQTLQGVGGPAPLTVVDVPVYYIGKGGLRLPHDPEDLRVREIPPKEYSWWAHVRAMFLAAEEVIKENGVYLVVLVPGTSRVQTPVTMDQARDLLGDDGVVLFQPDVVLSEASPQIETELLGMGERGLVFGAALLHARRFHSLLDTVTEYRDRNPLNLGGDVAYPSEVHYPAGGAGGDAPFPEFSAKAMFQFLRVIWPEKVLIDKDGRLFTSGKNAIEPTGEGG